MLLFLKGLTGVLPVAYALVFGLYVSILLGEEPALRRRWATRFLAAVVAIHLGTLFLRGLVLEHCPLVTGFEIVSFLALAIAATHLVVERTTGYRSPGIPALALALILQTLASSYIGYDREVHDIMRRWVVPLHAILGICGHAGFFTAATYALVYLTLYRQIKGRRLDRVWRELPPLESMHRMSFRAAGIGLAFFALAMLTGLGRAVAQGQVPHPLFASGVSFLAFAALLLVGRLGRLGGRRFAIAVLGATLVDLGTLFLTEWLHQSHVNVLVS